VLGTEYPVLSIQYPVHGIFCVSAKFDVGRLLALPLAAQRRQVRAWLEANAPDLKISFRLIERRAGFGWRTAGRKWRCRPGGTFGAGRQELLLESEAYKGREAAADYQYKLPVPGAVEIPELRVRIEAQVIDTGEFPERSAAVAEPGIMPAEFLIRNWRAGDRYCRHILRRKKR